MTKFMAYVLFVPIGVALSFPPVAHADTNSAQHPTEHDSTKSRKAYLKHQKKLQKSERKAQKKAQKNSKKVHQKDV
jgi:F0F1-type ATP synthase epsilon subunit